MHTGTDLGHRLRARWPAALVVAVFAVTALAGLLAALPGAAPQGTTVAQPTSAAIPPATPQVDGEAGRPMAEDRNPLDPPAGRPPVPPTLPGEHRHATPPARTTGDWVSGVVAGQQVLIADDALPWTWWLDPAVAARAGADVVAEAVAAWDGVPGSRWATAHAGEHAIDRPRADGRSTIFAERSCDELTTANTYLYTDGGIGADRYGRAATQILEADIGICPRADDPQRIALAIRHEIGHVVGLAHLCDPDEDCWRDGMGSGPHGCSVMYWQARTCQTTLSEGERQALVELYPTLRRLDGPDVVTTTARASFATVGDGTAPVVVVVAAGVLGGAAGAAAGVGDGVTPAAAAALAGRAGGSLLVAPPEDGHCLAGATSAEATRALASRGVLVLIGDWPASCDRLAYDWDVQVQVVPADPTDPAAGVARLAALGERLLGPSTGAVIVPADLDAAVAAAAADLAVRRDQPVAVEGDQAVAGDVLVLAGLAGADLDPVGDVVGAGAVLADLGPSRPGVVLAGAQDVAAALSAVPVAAARAGTLLLTGPEVDSRLLDRLAALGAAEGWVVGDVTAVPPQTAAAYGALVGR